MDYIGYLAFLMFIAGVAYLLILQIKHLIVVKKNDKVLKYKRLVLAHFLECFSIAGFLVSLIINLIQVMLIHFQPIISTNINTNIAVNSGNSFLFLFLISKFIIAPKEYRRKEQSILKK